MDAERPIGTADLELEVEIAGRRMLGLLHRRHPKVGLSQGERDQEQPDDKKGPGNEEQQSAAQFLHHHRFFRITALRTADTGAPRRVFSEFRRLGASQRLRSGRGVEPFRALRRFIELGIQENSSSGQRQNEQDGGKP